MKHRKVEEMLKNIETVRAEDVSKYVMWNHDSDNVVSKNVEDLINSMLDYEKAQILATYRK